jgi:hypothetical protein
VLSKKDTYLNKLKYDSIEDKINFTQRKGERREILSQILRMLTEVSICVIGENFFLCSLCASA